MTRSGLKNSRLTGSIQLLYVTCVFIMAGCAHAPQKDSVVQHFNKTSGATITTLAKPFSFYRTEPLLAANSRDYVYAGPVEINHVGRREYLLWLHYCSTIDRSRQVTAADAPSDVFLFIDEKPMELVQAQNDRLDESLYTVPVAGGYTVLYRVTRDQLRKLAQAEQIRLVVEAGPRNTDEYRVWNGAEEGFRLFASYLLDDADIVFAAVR